MSVYHVNIPRSKCPFLNEEENMNYEFVTKSRDEGSHSRRMSGKLQQYYYSLPRKGDRWRPIEGEDEEFSPMNYYSLFEKEQNPWFTVIPLNDIHVQPSDIQVKLNPLTHSLIIKVNSSFTEERRHLGVHADRRHRRQGDMSKPIKFVVNFPVNIRMDKLQVNLTQNGELVVCAPFKYSQQHQKYQQNANSTMNEETLNSQFIRDKKVTNEMCWRNLPIIAYSRIPSSLTSSNRRGRNVSPFGETYATETSESEQTDTSTSSTTSEDEWTTTDEEEEENVLKRKGNLSDRRFNQFEKKKMFLKEYVNLLENIFYPNIVDVNIVPLNTTTSSTGRRMRGGMKNRMNLQLICDIKFADFHSEDIKVRVDTLQGQRVLIIEGKKFHESASVGVSSVKSMRRVVSLPSIFNVHKIMWNILPNGVLTIQLPIMSMEKRQLQGLLSKYYGIYNSYFTRDYNSSRRKTMTMPTFYRYY